jgi:hypothetical protein
MSHLPIRRVVLYKHGIGYFQREGSVRGDQALALTFKQAEVSDVLKSLTVLDLDGGHVASVSYDSTKPLEQLLAEVALQIPDQGSLVSLLPQIKGAKVQLHPGVGEPVAGAILGIDTTERSLGDAVLRVTLLSVMTDGGEVRSFDLHQLAGLVILDPVLKRDLDFYLRTQLSSKKKDARTFTFFAQGAGERRIRLSYTLETPVWKATYRILLGEEGKGPMIQGWAVVDNTQDEDWENIQLSLIAGLPVSFVHDLYTPRYIRRPEVRVQETTGVLPPTMEEGLEFESADAVRSYAEKVQGGILLPDAAPAAFKRKAAMQREDRSGESSMAAHVRERKIGDLFEYEIEHPVTIHRNQSALVPIVLRGFEGRPVLLYNKANRADNPMRCVEFKNTTGLTLEGGPVTVLEAGSYVGEAMLETIKPDEERLVPYCVELAVHVHDHLESKCDREHRIVIRNGTLHAHYREVSKTTYHLNNKSDQEHTLYLEHPRGGDWTLFDSPDPHETTENYWRFRFTLPARQVTQFVVQRKRLLQRVHGLSDVNDGQFSMWLQQKYLDEATETALREAFELRQQSAAHEAALRQLEAERSNIHNEQKRIRENLQSLGDRPAEKELRERFIRTLGAQEDRLEAIVAETKQRQQLRDEVRQRFQASLAKLEMDAQV